MYLQNAKILDHNRAVFVEGDVRIRNGRIEEVGKLTPKDGEEVWNLNGKPVVPGLIDVHTHGCMGHDFVSCDSNDLHEMARFYASCGVTSVMATMASAPFEEMIAAISQVNGYRAEKNEADLCGVHMEGRYLNASKKGAHAPHLLAALDAKELQNEEFGKCRALHVTAAYELDEDGSFAEALHALGATMGLGHTAATYAQAKQIEARGLRAYTHLFNTMLPLHHREGGAVCAGLLGDCFTELICDGLHIAPEMICLAAKMKAEDRLVLISDSMEATGGADGEYFIAGNPVTVKNHRAVTPDGALAGSTLTLDVAVNNLMDFTGKSLAQAVICASVNAAKQVGIFERVGSIEVGKQADLVILSGESRFCIEAVLLRGEIACF